MKTFFNQLLILVFFLGFVACSEEESITPLKETVWVESKWVAENCEDPQNNYIDETGCTEEYCFKVVFGESTVEMIETNSGSTTTNTMEYSSQDGMITINGESTRYEIRGNKLLLFFSDATSPCDYYLEFVAE